MEETSAPPRYCLVTQGKIRYIGCSNWQAWKIAKTLGIPEFKNLAGFDTLQAYYSIVGRDLEPKLVSLLESEKTGLLVWSPVAGDLLASKFSRENQKLEGSRRSEFDFPIVDKERTWKILEAMAPVAKTRDSRNCRMRKPQIPESRGDILGCLITRKIRLKGTTRAAQRFRAMLPDVVD